MKTLFCGWGPHRVASFGAVVALCVLSSCGADDNDAPTPTAALSPSPSPTPTPSPAPTPAVGMIGIPYTGDTTTWLANVQYFIPPIGNYQELRNSAITPTRIGLIGPTGDATIFGFSYGLRPDGSFFSIRTDYNIADFTGTIEQGAFDSYERTENGFEFQAGLMRHEAANPLGLFKTVTLGRAEVEFAVGDGRERRVYSYAASENNIEPDLPDSGTFTYRGPIIGHALGTNSRRAYDLNGTIEMQIDFGARVITGTLDIDGRDREQNSAIQVETANFTSSLFQENGNWNAIVNGPQGLGIIQVGGNFNATGDNEAFGAIKLDIPDPSNSASELVAVAAYIAKRADQRQAALSHWLRLGSADAAPVKLAVGQSGLSAVDRLKQPNFSGWTGQAMLEQVAIGLHPQLGRFLNVGCWRETHRSCPAGFGPVIRPRL